MVIDKKKELFWLRINKFIACVGICSLIVAFVRFFVTSFWISAVTSAILMLEGYMIQTLLLGKKKRAQMRDANVEFSFEMSKKRLPIFRVLPAMLLSAAIAAAEAYALGKVYPQGDFMDIILIPVFTVPALVGCFIVRYRFNQLLSLRNLIEILAAFLAILIFSAFDAANLICGAVFLICAVILMNQEGIMKSSYVSVTCHVTDRVRLAGMWTVLRMLGRSVLLLIPLAGVLSLFATPFQILLYGKSQFPIPGLYVFNLIFFFVSVLSALAALFLFATRHSANTRRVVERARQISADIDRFLLHFASVLREIVFHNAGEMREMEENNKLRRERILDNERKFQHYVDLETPITVNKSGRIDSYRSFVREMKSKPDNNCKYCFAYRTLIDDLCASNTGIKYYHTPAEVRKILKDNGTVPQIDRIVQIYIDIAYAGQYSAVDDDLQLVCGVLQARLE